jgi:AcrR family transcriptional regulator
MQSRDDRLQELMGPAMRIFAERGFHATSMRDLSKASGMSLAGIYHYVRSKHELLFLIQDQCFAEVTSGAERALAPLTDPEERARAFICHHVVFFAGHMDKMKVLSHEDDELEGTMGERIRKRKRTYVELLTRQLMAVGHDGVTPQVATYALFGMMNWIYTWYNPVGSIAPAQLADELAQLFLNGYLPSNRNAAGLVASHGG